MTRRWQYWSQDLTDVNANVIVPMGTATEQIRVSEAVKRELNRRRREGESFNDVLERILDEDRDLLADAGFWTAEEADRVRKGRQKAKEKSKDRMRRSGESADEGA